MPKPPDILGAHEYAERRGVGVSAISTNVARGVGCPPDAVLKCGPVWLLATIIEWEQQAKK